MCELLIRFDYYTLCVITQRDYSAHISQRICAAGDSADGISLKKIHYLSRITV